MKPSLCLALVFLACGCATATRPSSTIQLNSEATPALRSAGPERHASGGGIYNVSVSTLEVFPAPLDQARGVGLIICPGGGYTWLDYRTHVGRVVPELNRAGITVFGLKYRTQPPSENAAADALADAQRAVRIVRSRADEFHLDPHKIGVQGYSAGGNLALNLEVHNDPGSPGAADAVDRASSRPDFVALMSPWPAGSAAGDFPLMKDSPPTFIMHARDDGTAPVQFSQDLAARLQELHVPVQLSIYPFGGHLAFNYGLLGPSIPWMQTFLIWLGKERFLPLKP